MPDSLRPYHSVSLLVGRPALPSFAASATAKPKVGAPVVAVDPPDEIELMEVHPLGKLAQRFRFETRERWIAKLDVACPIRRCDRDEQIVVYF